MHSLVNRLIKELGQPYSSEFGINLKSRKESEIFKWFLASLLFGKPIQECVAIRTIKVFLEKGMTTPNRILIRRWRGLVEVLGEGHYVRYDESTATKLLKVMEKLNEEYNGKVTNIYKKSKSQQELENRLMEFYGVGPVTVQIFLRELRPIWNVNPEVSGFARVAAKNLGINLKSFRKNQSFVRLECALLRLGKNFCRKKKCKVCKFTSECRRRR